MNELTLKKKEFEDSIKETEKQITELKVKKDFDKQHLRLIIKQIEVQNANTEQKKG
jgi:hypothetical protein